MTGSSPIVCAGGTSMAKGFLPELKKAIARTELPVKISDVYLAKDPANANTEAVS